MITMKYAGFIILFLSLIFRSYGQIENVYVEKYYISDLNDATDTTGGNIEPGTITYRVYVQLRPGTKIKKIYGDSNHALRFSSTELFFNNKADGQTFGKDFTKSRLQENTVALDSWITIGQATRVAAKTYFGIPKQYDIDGSVIGGSNNDGGSAGISGGLLSNSDGNAGLPLTTSDGLIPMTNTPTAWADYGFKDFITGEDSTIFGSLIPGNEFLSNNAGLQNSGVEGISPDTNFVLIAQLTTKGEISFEINLEVDQIINGITETVNYVANDDVLLPNEEFCALLKYPAACGCRDGRYLEYSNSFTCDNPDSCHTLIVYGCMDPMACNYDPDANLNLPELCCYPGYCNDRDILVVCPELSQKRIKHDEGLIYPNPAVGRLYINRTNSNSAANMFRLFDQFGKLSGSGKISEGENVIDVSGLSAGVYMIQLISVEEVMSQLVVIKN